MPIGENGGAENNDQREKAHGGLDGAVAVSELEEQRHVVDWDKARRVDRGGRGEEQHGVPVAQEVGREDASRGCREYGHALLDAEEDKKHCRDDEEGNYLAAVPWVQRAAEVDGHDKADDSPDANDSTDYIKISKQYGCFYIGLRLGGRQKEEVDRGEEARDDEVNVERPPPCRRRLGEGAAYDGPQDSTNAPDQPDKAEVARALLVRGGHGEDSHDAEVHAVATNASEHAADDEHVHAGRGAAERGADVEDDRG